MNRRGAFTLIELLVVVSIIALLIAILLPSMQGAMRATRLMVCASNVHQVATATLSYAVDHKRMAPSIGRFTSEQMSYAHYWTEEGSDRVGFMNWGLLSRHHYLDPHGDEWFCPLAVGTLVNPKGNTQHFNNVPEPVKNLVLLEEDSHLGWTFARAGYNRRKFGFTDRDAGLPMTTILNKAMMADGFSVPGHVNKCHGDGVTVGFGDGGAVTIQFDEEHLAVQDWRQIRDYDSAYNDRFEAMWQMFDRQAR